MPLHILFVYATRGRRQRFLDGLESIYANIYDRDNFTILVNFDVDDPEMAGFESQGRIIFNYGLSESKVHAINRGPLPEFDIIIAMQDDLRFKLFGFDELIRGCFADSLDKLLHIPDQDAGEDLATIYIAGSQYYNRFGYIYHPDYKSLQCDVEVQEVAKALGKYQYVPVHNVFAHMNSAYGHLPKDDMFIEQQHIGYTEDVETFKRRKAINFGL